VGRGLLESFLRFAYAGDWPARVWGALPWSCDVTVTRHTLRTRGRQPPCRIAFVSDLHVGPTTPVGLLERAFEHVRRERPDVLLLGGDYVFLDAQPRRLAVLEALVGAVPAPTKLAVLGNHDLWADDKAIVRALEAAGARVLVNETAFLPDPWGEVAVIGLDDPWTGSRDAAAAMQGTEGRSGFRIVLCHSPDGLRLLDGFDFDLYVAGHTHGGHVAAPWGPIVLPHGPLCRAYPAGLFLTGSKTIYVSRGLGGVEVPVRTFAAPDVLAVTIVGADPGR
jgi:predicted MPP superfamily phosphohydrolase